MGLLTAIRQLRYPVSTDAFNPPLHLSQLAADVDAHLDPSVADEDALPADGNWPGRSIWVLALKDFRVWNGTGWDRPTAPDTGWVNVTVNGGFAANGTPRVRRIGDAIWYKDGYQNTGMAPSFNHIVGNAPLGFRPASFYYGVLAGNSADTQGRLIIQTNGDIIISTGPVVAEYYRLDGPRYLIN